MTESDAIELLTQSIVMPSSFTPFQEFMDESSIAIVHAGSPLILLGPSNSPNAHAAGNRLMNEEQFHNLVDFLYGAGDLSLETVQHANCIQKEGCHSISQSTQGQLEYGEEGDFNLIALLPHPNQPYSQALAVGMCISNTLMKCLIPNSKDLPICAKINSKRL